MIARIKKAWPCLFACLGALAVFAVLAAQASAIELPNNAPDHAGKDHCVSCQGAPTSSRPVAPRQSPPVIIKCDAFGTPKSNDYLCGQCTWWAAYLRPDIPTSSTMWPRPAHASAWDDNWLALGLSITRVPEPGAIAVFETSFVKNDKGHVAYVLAAEPIKMGAATGYSMTVTHMNWDQCYGSTKPCQNTFQVSPDDEVSFIPPSVVLFDTPYFGGKAGASAMLRLPFSEKI